MNGNDVAKLMISRYDQYLSNGHTIGGFRNVIEMCVFFSQGSIIYKTLWPIMHRVHDGKSKVPHGQLTDSEVISRYSVFTEEYCSSVIVGIKPEIDKLRMYIMSGS